jgi:transcriptional regulator with XRE-family HTH domain
MRLDHEKVRRLRLAKEPKLSMREAGERAGFAKNQAQEWNKLESGTRPNVELSTIAKLAKALGVDGKELIAS